MIAKPEVFEEMEKVIIHYMSRVKNPSLSLRTYRINFYQYLVQYFSRVVSLSDRLP